MADEIVAAFALLVSDVPYSGHMESALAFPVLQAVAAEPRQFAAVRLDVPEADVEQAELVGSLDTGEKTASQVATALVAVRKC